MEQINKDYQKFFDGIITIRDIMEKYNPENISKSSVYGLHKKELAQLTGRFWEYFQPYFVGIKKFDSNNFMDMAGHYLCMKSYYGELLVMGNY